MSVITHGQFVRSSDLAKSSAKSSDLAFARQSANRWRRARALARRAWAPLIVYSVLAIALVAVLAIRVAVWVPQIWY